jgi:hypothetical protein
MLKKVFPKSTIYAPLKDAPLAEYIYDEYNKIIGVGNTDYMIFDKTPQKK